MGAPAGYLDPYPQVFHVIKSIPGPAKIFSHGSPGPAGQQVPIGIPVGIPAGNGEYCLRNCKNNSYHMLAAVSTKKQ